MPETKTARPNLTVRQAKQEELSQMLHLIVEANKEYASFMPDGAFEAYKNSIEQTIRGEEEEAERYLAIIDNQIAGAVILFQPYTLNLGDKIIVNPFSEMRLLAVDPNKRNSGVGAFLIEECERIILERGEEAITLHTTNLMKTAKAMYERRGYRRYPEIDFNGIGGIEIMGFVKEFPSKPN